MSIHPAPPAAGAKPRRTAVTLSRLREMRERGEPVAMLTAYDASFARVLDDAGVDMLLVGDSLGHVVQGEASTLPVTLEHMAYHTRCVARGNRSAFVVADLPFGSYEAGPQAAFASATALMRAGAQMIKLEGGGVLADTVRWLVDRGIPVCGHLGLTPQRVHALGGYRVQGRDETAAAVLEADARALAEAGAALLVLELVPAALARRVTEALPGLVTIGIGAGAGTAGQVLVLHDLLGISGGVGGRQPRFVRDFTRPAAGGDAPPPAGDRGAGSLSIADAVAAYVAAVKDRSFPDEALHAY